jgi:hypothetical protein
LGRGWSIAAVAVGLLLLAALALGGSAGQALFGRWSFTESVEVDRGTYFRLKVKLAYKGEPQDFDIVVGCNALQINYKDGSRTSEVGLVPTVYGRRMNDGKGLVVRPPNACGGETTANGEVPPNFMPVVVVYDDADTLAFGTAYISDEAYASPLSVLEFGGATIEAATRAEFDAFRRDGPPNLVTRESYHSYQHADIVAKMGLTKVDPAFARTCYAYRRFRIPESLKAHVRKYWPSHRPNYWMPTPPLQAEAFGDFRSTKVQRDTGGPFYYQSEFWSADSMAGSGVARSSGGGLMRGSAEGGAVAPSFYPVEGDTALAKWPADPDEWLSHIRQKPEPIVATKVDVLGGQARGFAYCFLSPVSPSSEAGATLAAKRAIYQVDEEPIDGAPSTWRWSWLHWFAYRDEYFFLFSQFYLDSTQGDV